MKTKLTPEIYNREDVQRAMLRANKRHTEIENDETDLPELELWMNEAGSLCVIDVGERLQDCVPIYNAEEGRLIE